MNKKHPYCIIIFLIIACCIAFGRIIDNDFVNFDDPGYITENYHVQSGISIQNIQWAFTTVVKSNWHPLTLISHMLDWNLFGANASGHHLVSLLLHIGAVIFLLLFLNKTTNSIWSSAFAAALFAMHPLRVESVAWAAERKDVLSMFFGMAALYAYAFYVESVKYSRYFICLILFALSLMSKPMLVTLPFLLLLLDYWPLGRWKNIWNPAQVPVSNPDTWAKENGELLIVNDTVEKKGKPACKRPILFDLCNIWEKVPFFILTAFSIGVTIWSQRTVIASLDRLPVADRTLNAILSYLHYIIKFVYPVDLAVFYPYPDSVPLWQVSIAAIFLLGISIVVTYTFRKVPFLFVGWFWYLGTLIPVIGLLQVGSQAMADRYTYLPSIGIAIMLSWGVPLLFPKLDIREKLLFPVATVSLAFLMFLTWIQCSYWKNSVTLYSHTLHVTKNNYLAHYNLGCTLFKEGKIKKAFYHFNEAILLKEDYVEAYDNRGVVYDHLGKHQRAIDDYNKAIIIKPDYFRSYYNRGVAYFKLGQYQRAIEDYNQTIRLKPDIDLTYNNIGLAYSELCQHQLAIVYFNKAIRLNPNYARAYNNRGLSYDKLNQYQLAIEDFNKAINLVPYYAKAYINRSNSYFRQGNNKLGCSDVQKACELGDCKTLESAKDKGYCR